MKLAKDIYPITTVTYPDGAVKEYITDEHITEHTPPKDIESFGDFMRGQTRYLEGYYVYDVDRYLRYAN